MKGIMKVLKIGIIVIASFGLTTLGYAREIGRIEIEAVREPVEIERDFEPVEIERDFEPRETAVIEIKERPILMEPTDKEKRILLERKKVPSSESDAVVEWARESEASSFRIEALSEIVAYDGHKTKGPLNRIVKANTNTLSDDDPEPVDDDDDDELTGDFNGDGVVDGQDLAYINAYLFEGGPAPDEGDVNGDGVIDIGDLTWLINQFNEDIADMTAYLFEGGSLPNNPGDVNGDGVIDIGDLTWLITQLNGNYDSEPADDDDDDDDELTGDFNGDGVVDGQDLTYINAYLFEGGPAPDEGDVNGDGVIDIGDVTYLINQFNEDKADMTAYLFEGGSLPNPGDVNGDGVIDIGDLTWLISQL